LRANGANFCPGYNPVMQRGKSELKETNSLRIHERSLEEVVVVNPLSLKVREKNRKTSHERKHLLGHRTYEGGAVSNFKKYD